MKKQIALLCISLLIFIGNGYAAVVSNSASQNLPQTMILFGTTEAYAPFASVDASGHVYGFSIAFSQMLCQEMQVRCVYKPMIFKDFFTELPKGSIDAAIGAIEITPGRQKKFAFTLPYLPSKSIIMAKIPKDKMLIKKMTYTVAENKVFGLQTQSAFSEYLISLFPDVKYKTYNTESELINALANGDVDFIIVQTAVANFWINQMDNNFYTIGKPHSFGVGIGIMLNQNNPQLLAQLNAAILKVTQTEAFLQLLETFFPEGK